jgi:hypothetical protein
VARIAERHGGGDEPENLTKLCAWHHLRGVHAGILKLSGRAADGLRFHTPLGAWLAGDLRATARRRSPTLPAPEAA